MSFLIIKRFHGTENFLMLLFVVHFGLIDGTQTFEQFFEMVKRPFESSGKNQIDAISLTIPEAFYLA